jgi:hypothetical protein
LSYHTRSALHNSAFRGSLSICACFPFRGADTYHLTHLRNHRPPRHPHLTSPPPQVSRTGRTTPLCTLPIAMGVYSLLFPVCACTNHFSHHPLRCPHSFSPPPLLLHNDCTMSIPYLTSGIWLHIYCFKFMLHFVTLAHTDSSLVHSPPSALHLVNLATASGVKY